MFIVIEGCVGVGKSTVAQGLAAHRRSELVLETFELNPFLPAFYEDPIGNAVETEFAFLLIHFHQLKGYTRSAEAEEIISDFHLGKDLIYAELNLEDVRAKRLFKEMYEFCSEQTLQPDLMICLSASTDLLLERVRRRKREFELKIDPAYYTRVNQAYEHFYEQYSGNKLGVSMDEWDFVGNPALFDRLSSQIDERLKTK